MNSGSSSATASATTSAATLFEQAAALAQQRREILDQAREQLMRETVSVWKHQIEGLAYNGHSNTKFVIPGEWDLTNVAFVEKLLSVPELEGCTFKVVSRDVIEVSW